MSTSKRYSGFTLLEILVTVSIISILAGIITVNLSSARKIARDARRKEDIQQIQTALELYYNDHRRYPTILKEVTANNSNYLTTLPIDPSGYSYIYSSGGSSGALACDQWYTVQYTLENVNDPVFNQLKQITDCAGESHPVDLASDKLKGFVTVGVSSP